MGVASLIVAASASSASAGGVNQSSNPVSSAINQYVEMLPTGGGAVAAGQPATAPGPLTAIARKALRSVGGRTAADLQTVATSPAYGAPSQEAATQSETTSTRRPRPQSAPSLVGALWGISGTDVTADGRRVVFLIVLVLLTTAAMLSTAFVRRWVPSGGHDPSFSDLGP
jgi:hypothetical protein